MRECGTLDKNRLTNSLVEAPHIAPGGEIDGDVRGIPGIKIPSVSLPKAFDRGLAVL